MKLSQGDTPPRSLAAPDPGDSVNGEMVPLAPRLDSAAPSVRAWFALVVLSMRRQARARQMVWIALALLGFTTFLVALNTALGRWDMGHWRPPRRGNQAWEE